MVKAVFVPEELYMFSSITREFRKEHGLTQVEFSILTGIPLGTVRNQEQGNRGQKRKPNPALVALLGLLNNTYAVNDLIRTASEKQYSSPWEVRALLSLLRKCLVPSAERGMLEVAIRERYPQYKLEDH